MALNKISNSKTIDTFIEKNGRPPEVKNPKDICEVADLIRDNFIRSGESTSGLGWYWMCAAKETIISYWKAKRLFKA